MKKDTLGQVLRRRRQALACTQRELAAKLGVQPSHIAYLEGDRRRPSLRLLTRLCDVLGLDKETLFILAHPEARSLISRRDAAASLEPDQVWREFCRDKALLARHQIKPHELKVLAQVKLLGKVTAPRDFLFILNTIRQAVEKQ